MIIIFDFEVFRYNVLLGALLVKDDNTTELKQIWDIEKIKKFYYQHQDDLWIGHNNDGYDNHVLRGILDDKNPYDVSKKIIDDEIRYKANLPIVSYDLMCCRFYSLKMTELLIGKKIHTTDVDFEIDRPLIEEEIKDENEYNADDLYQTLHNFYELKDILLLRLNLLNEFKLPNKYLTATEAQLAALVLHAKQIPGIENKYVKPIIYDTLRLKNQQVLNFYLNEGFRRNEKLSITLCGVEHQLGSGGIHAALKKIHETDMLYLDVSGYYNLVMLLYNLLPRTIPAEGREMYEYMYHQQLKLKGVDDTKRGVYKTILLAVFGAAMNKFTDFYDPQVGSLVTITGQIFIVDLLEKLEGKIKLIQSNTDGIIVKPINSEDEVLGIVNEWCKRTGFVIKPKKIKEIYQRDVNNYCVRYEDGKIDHHGDLFMGNRSIKSPVLYEAYTNKEPAIISIAAIKYFFENKSPEETIEEYKDNLLCFQYICKKGTFEYCTYDTLDIDSNEVKSERIGNLNRAFAKKYDGTISMIYKHKTLKGKDSKTKLANVPDNLFIYNDEILSEEHIKTLQPLIDYQWYVERTYKRLSEFLDFPQIKDVNLNG